MADISDPHHDFRLGRVRARHDHGNLWVPLVINPGLPRPALIDDLVRQAESLRRLARE